MSRRVLVVDDHPSFRDIAAELLRTAGYEVVGEASDGLSAIAAASALQPDLVLLDIRLPDLDGFEVARQLMLGERVPQVVLVSSREAADYGHRLTESPALGFIAKSELSAERLAALLD